MTKKEIEALANDIHEIVSDTWLDEAKVVREYDDYRAWYVVEEAPDLDKLYEDEISSMCELENLTINEEEQLRAEIENTRYYEEDLKERAIENYHDSDNGDDWWN